MTVHLIKVSVGITSVAQLRSLQERRLIAGPLCQVTNQWPQREAELLDGGSLYWIIKGDLAVRQRITELERLYDPDGEKCGLILDPELVETELVKRPPHKGWRYLEPDDAPRDLRDLVQETNEDEEGEGEMSDEMAAELRELGLL